MKEYKVFINGDIQEWWLNGKRHREDGPAYIDSRIQEWWLNGKRHREDGPAYIDDNYKAVYWYLNGKQVTEQEFNKRIRVKEMTMKELCKILGYNVKIIK